MADSAAWRMTRQEMKEVLSKYEKAVEDDGYYLVHPSKRERQLLGRDAVTRRAEAVQKAREMNQRFVEAVLTDLDQEMTDRKVADMRCLSDRPGVLPASSYGSLASVFLHLFRDWMVECEHVRQSTYEPAIAALKSHVPSGSSVLLPGAGLGRFALELAKEGYQVEANDASRLFLTFADFLLNRAPEGGLPLMPLAHVFSENWGHAQQYMEVQVPCPQPASLASKEGEAGPSISFVCGDFVKNYGYGCPGRRKFDAVVTCFFIDTVTDFTELMDTLDGLLDVGGVWLNVGPLNWRKEARLKLAWSEITTMWQNLGYEFLSQDSLDCDYHLKRGLKMYTESYNVSLTVAVKRRASDEE